MGERRLSGVGAERRFDFATGDVEHHRGHDVMAYQHASTDEFEVLLAEIGTRSDATSAIAYLRLLINALRQFRYHTEGVDLFRLAIQGWAHAQSHPKTKAMIMASFQRQRVMYTDTVARWTSKADASAVGAAIGGAVIGYVVQSAFSDADIDPKHYCKGLSRLS